MNTIDTLKLLSENWFLKEPAFFSLLCQQQLEENARMECAIRCGQGRIEYNPLLLSKKNYAEVEQLMRVEMIRLFLKHPYERQPEGCSKEAISIGSDITIGDGYCMLHKDKLPVHDPAFYHLPLGQYFEWYAKQIQQQKQDELNKLLAEKKKKTLRMIGMIGIIGILRVLRVLRILQPLQKPPSSTTRKTGINLNFGERTNFNVSALTT